MYAFAALIPGATGPVMQAVLHGLMLTAVAVVAQALWSMARSLCPDLQRGTLAVLSGVVLLLFSRASAQIVVMLLGALAGWLLCASSPPVAVGAAAAYPRPRAATAALILYAVLLGVLAALAIMDPRGPAALAAVFYRAGALVFGGGHVVLPLLRQELVPEGWVSDDQFLAGYGLAQSVPGPLFTVAAYLGAVGAPEHLSALWATLAVVAIFLPGLLLATGGLTLLSMLVRFPAARAMLAGVNASVVGILGAALYNPVWRGGVRDGIDATTALVAFVLLQRWQLPPPVIAGLCVGISVIRQWHFL
jgi:chromate transporter